MGGERLVKFVAFIKKKPGITDEEFHKYWTEKHGPLVRSIPVFQEKILKYTQYHNSMALRSQAASLGFVMEDFDGAAEFVAADLETIVSVLQNPEFRKVLAADEKNFLSSEKKYMIGYDLVMMDRM